MAPSKLVYGTFTFYTNEANMS